MTNKQQIQKWYSDNLAVLGFMELQDLIDEFCIYAKFKLPYSIRTSGKSISDSRFEKMQYKFVSSKWNKFMQFTSYNVEKYRRENQSDTESNPVDGKSLSDSLVKF